MKSVEAQQIIFEPEMRLGGYSDIEIDFIKHFFE